MTKKAPPLDPSRFRRATEADENPDVTQTGPRRFLPAGYSAVPDALRPASKAVDLYREAIEAKDVYSAVTALVFAVRRLEEGWLELCNEEHGDLLPHAVAAIEEGIEAMTAAGYGDALAMRGQCPGTLAAARERALQLRLACWWWAGKA